MNDPVQLQTACSEAAFICWIEGHPGIASWLSAFGSLLALIVAFLVPVLAEQRARSSERRRDSIVVLNALAMAAGFADAFCTGLDEHGDDPAFDDAFPRAGLVHTSEALSLAVPAATRLGIAAMEVASARLEFESFANRMERTKEVRAAGNLRDFAAFMRRDAESFTQRHAAVSELLKFPSGQDHLTTSLLAMRNA